MFAGRPLTIEYTLAALRRRKLWILASCVVCAAAAAAMSLGLQNLYHSETVILVIPQRVPETYVRTTVTQPIESRLRTMSEQIRSRSRLERIIEELNLYEERRRETGMEAVVAGMNDSISLQLGRGGSGSFTLGFTYSDPQIAAAVADRLAEMFIDENLRDRESQAEGTSQFLETQLEAARQRLIGHEKKLETYRQRYSGQLPSQLASNLQVIQTTQQQIQALADATNRVREQRNTVQRQIADAETVSALAPSQAKPGANQDPTAAVGETAAQQLEAARGNLTSLLGRLTPGHPDVQILQARIVELEAKARTDAAAVPVERPTILTSEVAAANRLRELRALLSTLDRQIEYNESETVAHRQRIADYQLRVDALPSRESELAELTRDYGTLQETYKSLLGKKEESQLSTSLEHRQGGEQFKVLDPARVPEEPVSPNRPVLTGAGLLGGLFLGLLIAGALELGDSTLRTEHEITQALELPVLVMIPQIVIATERRRDRRLRIVRALAAILVCVGAGVAWWMLGQPGGIR